MQLAKNSAYLFSARCVNALAIMALTLIITRRLGPDIFGGYSFLNAVVMTGVVIANFGLDTFMVREVSRNTTEGNQLLSVVLGSKLVLSLMVMVAINAIFWLFLEQKTMVALLALFSIVVCLNSLSQSFWYYADAFQEFQVHAVLWASLNVIKVPLVWCFITIREDLSMVIYALIIAEVISLLISGCWTRLRFRIVFGKIPFKSMLPLLKRVWPMAAVFILSAIYFRVDMIILEVMKGEKAVGTYSAACRLIEFLSIIPGTVAMAALPGLATDYSDNRDVFRTKFFRTIVALGVVGAMTGSLLFLFSRHLILFLYGPLFSDSAVSLCILSGSVFFLFVNGYWAFAAISTNHEKRVASIVLVSTILNILMNICLIPRYSGVGAAISTLISEIFMLVLYVVCFSKEEIFFFRQRVPKTDPMG